MQECKYLVRSADTYLDDTDDHQCNAFDRHLMPCGPSPYAFVPSTWLAFFPLLQECSIRPCVSKGWVQAKCAWNSWWPWLEITGGLLGVEALLPTPHQATLQCNLDSLQAV